MLFRRGVLRLTRKVIFGVKIGIDLKILPHRYALEEKAAYVARCSEDVCSSLIEETLDVEIAELTKEVFDAELQQIHKFIKR